jgi:hypothetical protein
MQGCPLSAKGDSYTLRETNCETGYIGKGLGSPFRSRARTPTSVGNSNVGFPTPVRCIRGNQAMQLKGCRRAPEARVRAEMQLQD